MLVSLNSCCCIANKTTWWWVLRIPLLIIWYRTSTLLFVVVCHQSLGLYFTYNECGLTFVNLQEARHQATKPDILSSLRLQAQTRSTRLRRSQTHHACADLQSTSRKTHRRTCATCCITFIAFYTNVDADCHQLETVDCWQEDIRRSTCRGVIFLRILVKVPEGIPIFVEVSEFH